MVTVRLHRGDHPDRLHPSLKARSQVPGCEAFLRGYMIGKRVFKLMAAENLKGFRLRGLAYLEVPQPCALKPNPSCNPKIQALRFGASFLLTGNEGFGANKLLQILSSVRWRFGFIRNVKGLSSEGVNRVASHMQIYYQALNL